MSMSQLVGMFCGVGSNKNNGDQKNTLGIKQIGINEKIMKEGRQEGRKAGRQGGREGGREGIKEGRKVKTQDEPHISNRRPHTCKHTIYFTRKRICKHDANDQDIDESQP